MQGANEGDARLLEADERAVRGLVLRPHETTRSWSLERDAVITWIGATLSRVERVDDYESRTGQRAPQASPSETVWLPGFVDTHVHYPQTAIIGSASGPLLSWLERSVFPEEGRFAELDYARRIAERFCDNLLKQGSTSAAIYSSSHAGATDVLFETLSKRGLRAEVGLTLMDRGAPEGLLCPVDQAMEASEALVERWHGAEGGRLRFCVTPRFGLSCTPELLRAAGRFAQERSLWVQTHISENPLELEATAEAFPESSDYLAVYEDHGLLSEKTLLAHCIWLTEREWARCAELGATITHCPDSNFFLGSGQMSLKQAFSHELSVGIGSDVGAGRSFSLRRACARAYDASRITGSALRPSELLWLATRGGAIATGRGGELGCVAEGYQADLINIALPEGFEAPQGLSDDELLELLAAQLIFCEDWDGMQRVFIQGRERWRAPTLSQAL